MNKLQNIKSRAFGHVGYVLNICFKNSKGSRWPTTQQFKQGDIEMSVSINVVSKTEYSQAKAEITLISIHNMSITQYCHLVNIY